MRNTFCALVRLVLMVGKILRVVKFIYVSNKNSSRVVVTVCDLNNQYK